MNLLSLQDNFLGEPGEVYYFQHIIWAYTFTGVLVAANKLDIFTILSRRPASADEIALQISADPASVKKLLIACNALRLVERQGEYYQNTAFANRYLVRDRPGYLGNIIAHQHLWERWQELDYFIRTGSRGPKEKRIKTERGKEEMFQAHRTWILAMHDIAMSGQADALASSLELSGQRMLCDVGGGPGTYAIELCRRYPQMKAIVLDLPETEPIAQEIIHSSGMSDRVSFKAADYLKDDYGLDFDVVLLSGVLHGETPEDCQQMLRKVFQSLKPGGLVVVQEILLNEEKTGPLLFAIFNLHMTSGAAYTGQEISAWMQEAGFVSVKVQPLTGYSWLNAIIIGEKPI